MILRVRPFDPSGLDGARLLFRRLQAPVGAGGSGEAAALSELLGEGADGIATTVSGRQPA
jgi:hypothetical protein